MSKRNRKIMYDGLVKADRIKDIVQRLIDEFGNPTNKEEVAKKSKEAEIAIAKEEAAKEKEKKKEYISLLTEKQLYAMNKDQQSGLLKELGVTNIPRYEKDRVNKILELGGK